MLGKEYGYLEIFPSNPVERRSDREVILLLHGLSGNKFDWAWPEWRRYNYDHESSPPSKKSTKLIPPIVPLGIPSDASLSERKPVGCWCRFLTGLGHTVIVYSQDGPKNKIDEAYKQLNDLIVPYIKDEVLTGTLANKKVTVLAHSRGGVLIRLYLTRANDADAASWLSTVITLHSPHTGSRLGGLEDHPVFDPSGLSGLLLGSANALWTKVALRFALDFLMDEGARQLAPEDPLFDELDVTTNPVPGISFHTYAGTSVTLIKVYLWFYSLFSYIPLPTSTPPFWKFDWEEIPVEIASFADSVASQTGPFIAELTPGLGDILVAANRAQLDFSSSHHQNQLNHAEALTDETLFREVAELLGTPTTGGDVSPCTPGFVGNMRTRQLHDLRNENTNCQIDEILEIEVFETIDLAKAKGYDGCYWCLREEHTPD